jgi:hypothetical protein
VTLFTVQLELGPETRSMIERLAKHAAMHLEFGPKTRETLKSLFPKEPAQPPSATCPDHPPGLSSLGD